MVDVQDGEMIMVIAQRDVGVQVAGQATATGTGQGVVVAGDATPAQILEAYRAQRSELRDQLRRMESERNDLVREIQRDLGGDANQRGLEARLTAVDQRISGLDQALAAADAEVAKAAAVPGAVPPPPLPPPFQRSAVDDEVLMFGILVSGILLLPIMIAWTRRVWRRSAKVVATIPNALADRFTRLEHAVDSVAIEVERIGEGQRFMTRVLAEHGVAREALPASLTDELNLPPEASSRRNR